MHKGRLTDELWPEADGDAAQNAFNTALHRLRQLLGNEEAITLNEGRVTIDPRHCWVDIWAFERLTGDIDVLVRKGDAGEATSIAEKAVAMYRGEFLASDDDKPWAVSARERVKNKLIRHIGDMCRHYEEAGQFKKAIGCYNSGLEADNLLEAFYQRLMVCYHKLGRKAEGLAVYSRLKNVLSSTFDIKPSPRTDAVYKTLLS